MDKIADFVDAEELEELQAKRNQHQKLEEDLKEGGGTARREEVLLWREWRDPDLERMKLFASKSQNI